MSNLDFSGLKDISTSKTKAGWSPLTLNDLGYGSALCFDQSLSATGVMVVVRDNNGIAVYQPDQWKKTHEGKQVVDWLVQGVDIFNRARPLIRATRDLVDACVHESPPNPAAVKKGNSVSSLLAAQALRCAAAAEGVEFEMLGAQSGKRLVCGNANASKAEAHAALKAHVLPWVENSQTITNEAMRDTLMVGLVWLHRRADPA